MNYELKEIAKKYRDILEENRNDVNEVIYHYTSPESLLSILNTGKIWFSDVKYLNDASEINHTYELLNKQLNAYKNDINQEFFSKIKGFLTEDYDVMSYVTRTTYYVASFSTDNDNLGLWNYFTKTNNMAGYNIGINKINLINKIQDKLKQTTFLTHNKVIYSQKEQESIIKRLLFDCNAFLEKYNSEIFQVCNMFIDFISIFSLFFKKSCFQNEQEYRIIIEEYSDPLMKDDQVFQCKHRTKLGLYIPYIEQEFDKSDINEICVSPTIKEEHYKNSLDNLLIQLEYFNIKTKNSLIPIRY